MAEGGAQLQHSLPILDTKQILLVCFTAKLDMMAAAPFACSHVFPIHI